MRVTPNVGTKYKWGSWNWQLSTSLEYCNCDATLLKLCVHLPQWCALIMVHWRSNSAACSITCRQRRLFVTPTVYNSDHPLQLTTCCCDVECHTFSIRQMSLVLWYVYKTTPLWLWVKVKQCSFPTWFVTMSSRQIVHCKHVITPPCEISCYFSDRLWLMAGISCATMYTCLLYTSDAADE